MTSKIIGLSAALLVLASGCVWDRVCVNGAERVNGRCVGETGGPDAGEDGGGGPQEAIASVTVGGAHICARTTRGRLLCWGNNSLGQLGQGDLAETDGPREVSFGGASAQLVSASAMHTCATDSMGRLWCWGGQSGSGELGAAPSPTPYADPVQVNVPGAVIGLSAGFANTCVSVVAGVRCWGRNDHGQVANGAPADIVQAPGDFALYVDDLAAHHRLETVSQIAIGDRHICFRIGNEGKVYCAGQNDEGQLGFGTTDEPSAAADVPLDDVTDVAVADSQTCAVAGGDVYCWGNNEARQVAPELADLAVLSPTRVPGVSGATQVVVGDRHACALAGGSVYCWGSREDGRLGDGVPASEPAPSAAVEVSGIDDAMALSASLIGVTCALREGGRLSCWGQDGATLLGAPSGPGMFLDGALTHATPVDVDPL